MWIHRRLRSALAFAAPFLFTREQPQEHSHEKYLQKVHDMLYIDNTINAIDPVFGLLVDVDAEKGKGTVSDVSCLQMAIADVAYTNSKKTSDLEGMVASLIYRTLERNTNGVGTKSALCTTMSAVNPEIAALEQHQDPASSGATAHNRAVVLELARQISLIGGDPTVAIEAGTFAPGTIGDLTGKGNTCDEPNCIYENNRLQVLVSSDEIAAYVSQCVATVTVTVTQTGPTQTVTATQTVPPVSNIASAPITTRTSTTRTATGTTSTRTTSSTAAVPTTPTPTPTTSSLNINSNTRTTATQSTNLQTFTGALGGISAPAVTASGSRFAVEGSSDTLPNLTDALGRSCDTQHNLCADFANSSKQFTVGQCDIQNDQCHAAISS